MAMHTRGKIKPVFLPLVVLALFWVQLRDGGSGQLFGCGGRCASPPLVVVVAARRRLLANRGVLRGAC